MPPSARRLDWFASTPGSSRSCRCVSAPLIAVLRQAHAGQGLGLRHRRGRRRARALARRALALRQQGGGTYERSAIDWFQIGPLHMELGQYVDGLTAVMLVVVTAVSLCVHVYSIGYMHGDRRFTWFYVVLSLFTAAMLNVVIANNLFQLLVGWEVMGVCSYLLIGHWWEEHVNSSSAIKAFITTRIGDVPFMFGIFVLIAATGFTTSNIREIGDLVGGRRDLGRRCVSIAGAPAVRRHDRQVGAVPAARVAARRDGGPDAGLRADPRRDDGRGRRLPGRPDVPGLHRRRPVGPAGRRDRSAASRCSARRCSALVQDDIKRVLAYSTVSQLGYMIALMSIGSRRAQRRVLPPVHARVLQGAAVPRLGLGDPRLPHQQHERDGRPAEADARHVLDVPDRLAGARRASRRSPASGRRTSCSSARRARPPEVLFVRAPADRRWSPPST